MINRKDLYTFHTVQPLIDPTNKTQIGATIIRYEIKRYRDLRNLSDTLAYQVICTQRIVIPNRNQYTLGQVSEQTGGGFCNYPALVMNCIAFTSDPDITG